MPTPPLATPLADALAAGPVVLDGGLATLLEAHGSDLTSSLWSARLLRDDPAAIGAAHREYFEAGARVAISASYQASFDGFAGLGIDRDAAAALMARSVEIARRARDLARPDGWVAASVGPYGAVLADGSEYRGDYGLTIDQLRDWHRPRLEVLRAAGADVLAVETVPSLAEATAVVAEIAGTGHPAWLALTVDGPRTRTGEPLDEVFAMASEVPEIIALGVNCTAPEHVADAVAVAARYRPVVVYPNSGQGWDATNRCWTGSAAFDATLVREWIDAGARLVGGCCRIGPAQISQIARITDSG
jgi:homocysteine S-methyltransferase